MTLQSTLHVTSQDTLYILPRASVPYALTCKRPLYFHVQALLMFLRASTPHGSTCLNTCLNKGIYHSLSLNRRGFKPKNTELLFSTGSISVKPRSFYSVLESCRIYGIYIRETTELLFRVREL
jgi:hypothetical protein